VRITAPTIHHAENLKNIRNELRKAGVKAPLVADIHFTPQAAMIAADHVEKVRINPGNFADRKLFAVKEYTDQEYESELQRMAEKFIPLVQKCKRGGIAMRIGTNHGSLSDRIMNRYGDTPLGMVESALEFVRLCEAESYRDLIISMKASSPFIMIEAYRLLAQRMAELGMDYPFHLGVTEAGEGEDGRIKSAIGIGSLLEDGLGDTVRVSLTEDSIHEIPVAYQLVKKFNEKLAGSKAPEGAAKIEISWDPMNRERRKSEAIVGHGLLLGSNYALGAAATLSISKSLEDGLQEIESWSKAKKAEEPVCDLLFLDAGTLLSPEQSQKIRGVVGKFFPEMKLGVTVSEPAPIASAFSEWDAVRWKVTKESDLSSLKGIAETAHKQQKILKIEFKDVATALGSLPQLKGLPPLLLSLESSSPIYDYRRFVAALNAAQCKHPIHLVVDRKICEDLNIEASSLLGSLLMDGIGDSIEVRGAGLREASRLEFNILQASRLRISKAEFIACPSCGRTLFDLQETTKRIKTKTEHLKGVKIAIMGCIVNGPGEMADADFCYVGGGPGRIHLYVGKECVQKNIPSEIADEKLIELIKQHGRWVEPMEEVPALNSAGVQ